MQRAFNLGLLIIGLLSAACTIVLTWLQWAGAASADARIGFIVLTCFSALLLCFCVVQEFRYARKARYAEALTYLNRIVLDIQGGAVREGLDAAGIREVCRHVVNGLASVFSLVTSTRCSVCIKVIEVDFAAQPIRPRVITLCRDDTSMADRSSDGDGVIHWVDQNTDFEDLHESAGTPRRYFFSNRLSGIRGYKNTSFEVYGHPWDIGPPVFCDILRDVLWPLPYRSTIVVPISRLQPNPGTGSDQAGYLCVDSRSRGAFRRRYDLDLMMGVGYCLYALVHRYCQVVAAAATKR